MNRPFDYQQELDTLHFTPEQKKRIAEQTLAAAKQASSRGRRPVRRMLMIAAAAVLVLAVGTAGATGVLKSAAESFASVFGGNVAQTEIIDQIGRPIGASATDNGVTITADAILGDQYNACIVYTITRDDGQPLLPEGTSPKSLLMGGFGGADLSIRGGCHGSSWFIDENPDDSAIQMVQSLSADVPITSCTATAEFQNLCYFDEETGSSIPIVEGHWKFRFDVDYEDASLTLGAGETFAQGGMTFTVDKVTVSPVAVQVAYTVDSPVQWSDAPSGRQSDGDRREMERYFENVEILLTKTDGTVIDLSKSGGSIKPEDGVTVCTKGQVLDEILPLADLESVSVGGVVFDIPAQ